MGAGRKTSTYDVDTSAATVASFEEAKRNLGETGKLGGVIFGCSRDTIRECLQGLIFGLPRSHFSYVYWIEPGLPVFLFNYNDRNMHGIFRATTYGQLEINPYAWTESTTLKTRFPSQVEVEVWKECSPIHERDFKPIIKHCYYQNSDKNNYFVFELTKSEAKGLINKFEQTAKPVRSTPPPQQSVPRQPQPSPQPQQQPQQQPQHQPARSSAPAASASVSSSGPATDEWQVVTKRKAPKPPTNASGTPAWSLIVRPPSPVASSPTEDTTAGRAATNFATEGGGDREDLELQQAIEESRAEAARTNFVLPVQSPVVQSPAASLFEAGRSDAPPAFPSPGSNGRTPSNSGRPLSSNSNPSSLPLALRAPGPASSSSQALQGLTRSGLEDRIQLQPDISLQQRENRVLALCAERQRLLGLASHTTGMESLGHTVKAVQTENEELRHGQAILAAEIKTLQRQMLAMQTSAGRSPVQAMSHMSIAGPVGSASGASEASSAKTGADEMFMVGGNTGDAWLNNVDIFTPPGSWRHGAPMPEARGYGALAAIPGSILYLGGGNGSSWMSSVIRYDLNSCSWVDGPDMSTARGSLATTVLDNKVYAIGGGQPAVSLESIEIWDLNLNSFMSGKNMMQKRFTTAAAALGGCIYAVGGYNTSRYLDSMERLDPREGHWCNAASMQQKRGAHSVTVVNDQLIAIGGWDGQRALDVVEAYDPRADQWRLLKPLPVPRSYCAAATISGRVVVAGGMDGPNHVETMQRLDMGSGNWLQIDVPASVPSKRSFLAACVVPHHT